MPVVLLARTVPGFTTDAVELDDKGAAYEGVTHLLRLGYRRVGFIGGLRGASTSRRRLDGYKAALRDWKIQLDPALVAEGDFRVESGYRAGLDLLKQRPDAVFIANYLMTVGFMEALRQYRLRCPEDVALVTCDDYPVDGFVLAAADDHRSARSASSAPRRRSCWSNGSPSKGGRPRTITLKNAMRVRESCGCGAARQHGAGAMTPMTYDVLAIGRSSIDLYAHEIGAPITDVRSFDAYVGGCPTNVSVGTRRLGLRSALLTAVGDDQVGDFVTAFLDREQVETRFIPRKPGRRTSAVILTIQPPDRFPLTFYRDNCADRALTLDDVARAPVAESRVVFVTGTGLSHEPARAATFAAAAGRARGRRAGRRRHRLPRRSMGRARRRSRRRCATLLRSATLAVGTEEELAAASGDARRRRAARRRCSTTGIQALILKRGARGVDGVPAATRAGRRRAVSDRGAERARRRRRVRERLPLRLPAGLAARARRAHGQRLRRDRRHPPRLRQLHADARRGRRIRRRTRRAAAMTRIARAC